MQDMATSLGRLMRTVPGKRTSRDGDVDWSTADSLEDDINHIPPSSSHIEGSLS